MFGFGRLYSSFILVARALDSLRNGYTLEILLGFRLSFAMILAFEWCIMLVNSCHKNAQLPYQDFDPIYAQKPAISFL